MINATSVIFTRVILFSTKGNFPLAVVAHETGQAFALVGVDEIDAGGVVLAFVVQAVVDVVLAPQPGESRMALTTDIYFLQYI